RVVLQHELVVVLARHSGLPHRAGDVARRVPQRRDLARRTRLRAGGRRPVRARRARRRPALPARTAVGYGRWRARRPGPSAAALPLRAPAVAPQPPSPTLPRLRRRGTQPRSTGRHGRVQPPSGVAPPARRPTFPARVAVPRRARTLDAEAPADAAA